MENKLKKALQMRFEYYNLYEEKEHKWHEKYENHHLYNIVLKSLKYNFKEIALIMPKLLNESEKNL
ncbi:MAG: hypothetical protein KA073_01430 [Aliarcobacter sp.]|nr:hypothetical protein [Aliarcobacter sp.]